MNTTSADASLTVAIAGASRLVVLDRADEAVDLAVGHLLRYVEDHGPRRGGAAFVRECRAIAGDVGEALACLAAHRVADAAGVNADHVLDHVRVTVYTVMRQWRTDVRPPAPGLAVEKAVVAVGKTGPAFTSAPVGLTPEQYLALALDCLDQALPLSQAAVYGEVVAVLEAQGLTSRA